MDNKTGLQFKYFVLKPKYKEQEEDPYAQASCAALRAYAKYIEDINPSLAMDLRVWAGSEESKHRSYLERARLERDYEAQGGAGGQGKGDEAGS